VVWYPDLQPFDVKSVPQFLEPFVDWFLPELQVANTKVDRSVSLLVLFQILFLASLFPVIQL
jgi:hypothetical protein